MQDNASSHGLTFPWRLHVQDPPSPCDPSELPLGTCGRTDRPEVDKAPPRDTQAYSWEHVLPLMTFLERNPHSQGAPCSHDIFLHREWDESRFSESREPTLQDRLGSSRSPARGLLLGSAHHSPNPAWADKWLCIFTPAPLLERKPHTHEAIIQIVFPV